MHFRLFWRLTGLLFLFYTVMRLQFLFWNRELYSEDSFFTLLEAFAHGLRFDAVSIGWTLLLMMIWGWVVRRAYWIPLFFVMLPFWVLTVIDTELWSFFGRRMSLSVLKLFREAEGKVGAMAGEYAPWIVLACLIGAALFFLMARVTWKTATFRASKSLWKTGLGQLALLALVILASRGGWQKKPLTPVNAHLFEKSHLNQLVLNTPFTLLKSLKGSGLVKEKYFESHQQALSFLNFSLEEERVLPSVSWTQKQNVVVIILESFSWEYSALNPAVNHDYMPFLNALMKESLTFRNGMANGRRSIEGVGALLSGIPALMEEPFISSEFSTNKIEGLGAVFSRHGYSTSFFHGGDNGTMHFDAFATKVGFSQYFGSREYPNPQDHDGIWGIWDRPYLRYFAHSLNDQREPFLSVVFTLSSHQPYLVPEDEKSLFPEREHPILKSVAYADSSLKEFFEIARTQSWYENTLFVILADHTGPMVFHRQDTPLMAYRIPILFYHPKISQWPEKIDRLQLAQQIDIPGSLYDFLGFDEALTTPFSRSLFRTGPKHYTAFAAGIYWQTDGKTILVEQGKQRGYVEFDAPFVKTNPSAEIKSRLQSQLQATRQIYSFSLWENAIYEYQSSGEKAEVH